MEKYDCEFTNSEKKGKRKKEKEKRRVIPS